MVNSEVTLDPCRAEETKGEGRVALAYMPSFGKVTHMLQTGKISHAQLQEAVDLCTDACVGIVSTMMKACLLQTQ